MYSFPVFLNDLEIDRIYPEDVRSAKNKSSFINIWLNADKTNGYHIIRTAPYDVYRLDLVNNPMPISYIGCMTGPGYRAMIDMLL